MALRRSDLAAALDEEYPSTFLRLQRMFRARGIPREEAADLAQETAARLLKHLDRRGDVAPDPGPLMHRIATNLMIDRARSHARRVISLDDVEGEDPPAKDDPVEEVSRRHNTFVVRRAIAQLSDKQRLVMALTLDGLTPQEIATVMNMERNAVDALLFRGRRTLAERLRSVRHELHALVLLPLLKLRSIGRKTSSNGSAAGMSPALLNVVSAALAMALAGMGSAAAASPAVAAVAHGGRAHTDTTAGIAGVHAKISHTHGSNGSSVPGHPVVAPPSVKLDPKQHSIDIESGFTNPFSGAWEPLGAQVWQARDKTSLLPFFGKRGLVGPIADGVTTEACSGHAICGN